ncbi:MAG: ribonuclease D [Gammaproteobacteria bacterium]|nr:ribonuclease D [Gammaproteobacteria bacterium]MDE2249839.1 ribonuclease D [Gammaproteobacteria bacterium]
MRPRALPKGAITIPPAPITDAADLTAAAAKLLRQEALGLDTEFMRERTYYAQLCLVQLGAAGIAVCADPLALTTLDPLRPLMLAPAPCKILHAARQDLEVLAPVVGPVRNVFDTQVAAALVGFPAQVGYADLARQILGVELHKSQTRTDWSRRPLSAAQLDYALDDVRHLPPLREQLAQRLDRLGRRGWFDEEMQEIGNESFLVDPDQAWQRIKAFAELDPDRQRLAQLLAAWRERRAMGSNRPRGWILPDAALRDIVFQVPRSHSALERIRELPDGIRENSGAQLLELVSAAAVPEPPTPLPQRRRPDPEQTEQLTRLADITRRIAGSLELAPELLATRRELEQLARGARELAVLRGWRRAVIGEALLEAG